MRITLEHYDSTYEIETEADDMSAHEIMMLFARLLVAAGYPPSVLITDDAGSYQFVHEDEEVVERNHNDKENQSNQVTTQSGIYQN